MYVSKALAMTILAMSPFFAMAEGSSIQLNRFETVVGKFERPPESSFKLYCADSNLISLIQENDHVISSDLQKFREYLLENPDKSVRTALVGYNLTYRQVADAAVLNHGYQVLNGGNVIVYSFVDIANGYDRRFLDRIYEEAKLEPTNLRAKVVLTGACGVSQIGAATK